VSIEMYSAAWCSACSRAKAWMRDQNISYHEIDVDQRTGAMGQLAVLNPRRTLPTFDVQGEVLVGFEPGALESAIRGAAR
jgi:glutaredoxin